MKTWNLTIEDRVGSPPFALVGGILLAVRTPRSSNFVTVEVGLVSENPNFAPPSPCEGVQCCSSPPPWISKGWSGEMMLGRNEPVVLELNGRTLLITLKDIDDTRLPPPWASYEFLLQEGEAPRVGPSGGH